MLAKRTVRVKIVVLAWVALLLWPSGAFAVSHHAIQEPLIAATSTVATQRDQFNHNIQMKVALGSMDFGMLKFVPTTQWIAVMEAR